MKTVNLFLGQPVSFIIELEHFNTRIFQKRGYVNIRMEPFQILDVALDNSAVIILFVFHQVPLNFLMSSRMINLILNLIFSIMYSLYSRE